MIVLFSDPHLHPYSGSSVLEDGANARLEDVLSAMDAVLATAVKHKARAIICGGDLFHDRKGVKHEALYAAGEWMDRVKEQRIALHLLVGNHDMSLDCRTHSLRGFSGRATVHSRVSAVEIDGVVFGFLPYMEDPDQVRSGVGLLQRAQCAYVVGHLGLGDPKLRNCVPSDYEVPGRISLADLMPERFAQVFLGHYHLRQQVHPKVQYIGSPLQLSFGEADHPKGWLLLDEVSGKVEQIDNDDSPRYHIIDHAEAAADIPDTDFVWVKASSREEELKAQSMGRPNMRIDRAPVASAPARVDATAKGATLLRSYVKAVRPDALDHEVDELVADGLRLKGGS